MYTKTTIKDGYEITETYQNWYEIWLESWKMAFIFVFAGCVGFIVTPFMAIYSIWNPRSIGRQTVKIHDPDQCQRHEKSPFESVDNLT